MQERADTGDLEAEKIPRSINSTDLLTHHWTEREGEVHMKGMGVVRRGPHERGVHEGGSKNPPSLLSCRERNQ